MFFVVIIFIFAPTYRLDWYSNNTRVVKGKCVFTSEKSAYEEAQAARLSFPEYKVVVEKCR